MTNDELIKALVTKGVPEHEASRKVWSLSFIPRSDKKLYDREHHFDIEDPRFGGLKGCPSEDLDTIWDDYTERINEDDEGVPDWLSVCPGHVDQPAMSQFALDQRMEGL